MNVSKIQIDMKCLRRCVVMIQRFNPSLVSNVDTTVNDIVDHIRFQTTDESFRRNPFESCLIGVGPCIQVTYHKVFDNTTHKFLHDTVRCEFTVQPIVEEEADDVPQVVTPMTKDEKKQYWKRLLKDNEQ